jgi:uncharacterized RDD family membrane protein YckC
MQTIRVQTTQNVFIHYPIASVGERSVAYLIDSVLLALYAIAVIALFIKLQIETWWIWALAGLPFLFYSLLFEVFMNGQSPGKYIMKIQVVRLDGTPPRLGDYIMRWLLRFIDFTIFSPAVAMICIIAGGKGQRLGDIAAGTSVIKLAEHREIDSKELFIIPETEYAPVFQEVRSLSSRDIELIQRALEVNRSTGNNRPVVLLTEKIKSLLDIQSDMPPVKFLYTIVKDYNHLASHSS